MFASQACRWSGYEHRHKPQSKAYGRIVPYVSCVSMCLGTKLDSISGRFIPTMSL
jgi:hypothetical protein